MKLTTTLPNNEASPTPALFTFTKVCNEIIQLSRYLVKLFYSRQHDYKFQIIKLITGADGNIILKLYKLVVKSDTVTVQIFSDYLFIYHVFYRTNLYKKKQKQI